MSNYIEVDNKYYKLKPKAVAAPCREDKIAFNMWLVKNTYPRGYQQPKLAIGGFKVIA